MSGADLPAEQGGVRSAVPSEIRSSLGPSPLTDGENATLYEAMLESLAAAVAPADFVEWLWIKNVADLTWDIGRLRRSIAHSRRSGRRRALITVFKSVDAQLPSRVVA